MHASSQNFSQLTFIFNFPLFAVSWDEIRSVVEAFREHHVQHNERLYVFIADESLRKVFPLATALCQVQEKSQRASKKHELPPVEALSPKWRHELSARAKWDLFSCFREKMHCIDSFSFFPPLVYLPIVIFVPSLAFNQVTGVDVHITTWFVVIICVFYTCVVSF